MFCMGRKFKGDKDSELGRFDTAHEKLRQPRNYDFVCPKSAHRGPKVATTVECRLLHLAIVQEAKIALTMTAKLQQLRTNNREMTAFAESCNDHKMQRP